MFVVEFQNAFSDNVLRWLVTFMIIGMGFSLEKRDSLVPLVGDVFALPFILFSMAGGFFADRFSKRSVAIAVKCAELGIMSVVTLGLWLVNIPLMLAGIFLMSTHSAIFGPTKYGMLPELLPEKKLSWGNGIFGLGTFSAAITGHDPRRHALGHVRQKTGLVRCHPHRAGAGRLVAVPWRPAPARRRSAQKIPREFPRRFFFATQDHPPGPGFVSRRDRQHVPFVSGAMLLQLTVVFTARTFCIWTTGTAAICRADCSSASARAVWRQDFCPVAKSNTA